MNLIVNAIKYQWGKRNSVREMNMEKKLKRKKITTENYSDSGGFGGGGDVDDNGETN